jgi:hypothetical protein
MILPFGIPSPTTILIGLAAVGIVAGASFYEGHHYATIQEQAVQLKTEQAMQAKYDAQVVAYNQVSAQLEVAKNEHHTVTQTITKSVNKYIDRPIYLRECFDASGLSDANAALTGRASDPGKPDATLSATHSPD